MKTRNTSQNFIEDHIEISNVEKYVAEKRKAGMKNFGILHVLLAAYVLGFHRGRPVRLRLTCTLLLPVMIAALLHDVVEDAEIYATQKFQG